MQTTTKSTDAPLRSQCPPAAGWKGRLIAQFGHPRGPLGALAGWIMARRESNRVRNLRTVELLDIQPEDTVLEIGFGPGLAVEAAAARATRGRVVGVDHSERMRAQARRRNAAAIRDGRVDLLVGSADALPDLPAAIDKVLAVNTLQFWAAPLQTLQQVRERMRPGGRIAITFQPRKKGAAEQDAVEGGRKVAELLEDAGFAEVVTELLPMEPVPAVCVIATRPQR